jgi:hypothetical protein
MNRNTNLKQRVAPFTHADNMRQNACAHTWTIYTCVSIHSFISLRAHVIGYSGSNGRPPTINYLICLLSYFWRCSGNAWTRVQNANVNNIYIYIYIFIYLFNSKFQNGCWPFVREGSKWEENLGHPCWVWCYFEALHVALYMSVETSYWNLASFGTRDSFFVILFPILLFCVTVAGSWHHESRSGRGGPMRASH